VFVRSGVAVLGVLAAVTISPGVAFADGDGSGGADTASQSTGTSSDTQTGSTERDDDAQNDGTTADDKRFYMGLHDGLTPEGFDPWITPCAGPLQNQPDQ